MNNLGKQTCRDACLRIKGAREAVGVADITGHKNTVQKASQQMCLKASANKFLKECTYVARSRRLESLNSKTVI